MGNSPLPPRKYKTFLNDKDGLSAKDYLLLISTTIFFLFVSVGLIMILFQQEVDPMYLSLLDMVSPVVMMIVGSVFGINAVEAFTSNRRNKEKNVVTQKEIVTETNYENETVEFEDDGQKI
jgi:hypothetical protein